jgi:uncharacterized surface protein with fasciclin (FAS1) repeats
MKHTRKFSRLLVAVGLVAAVGTASVGTASAEKMGGSSSAATETVVGIAVSNPEFSTLVSAVTAAGLVDTLSGTGPFTVFAPTNDAFAKIPAATLQSILADKAALTSILTYHVVPGKVLAKDLKKRQSVKTVQGSAVDIVKKKKSAKIEGARITATDLKATNGVVHVIDTVILPPGI